MSSRLIQNWKLATFRAQIFADLIFVEFHLAIYDLICEIKFRVIMKYSISNKKPHDFKGKTHKVEINHEIKFRKI